ncbi:MAG: hypothetical protein FWH57_02840 [Oscillospiraceae bacterium]|nr:hypothetical protein [Oscillospiraceae bacterium]
MRKQSVKIRIARLIPIILLIVVLMGTSGKAIEDPKVTFNGEGGADSWHLTTQDLFGDKTKDLAPGLEATTEVTLSNNSKFSADFYLIAQPENSADVEIATLYDSIDILVTFKFKGSGNSAPEREIYRGKFGGSVGSDLYSEDGARLGTLLPSQEGLITVTVNIANTVGNKYMEKVCEANWEFKAVAISPQSVANGNTKDGNSLQDIGALIVDEDEIPLADKESTGLDANGASDNVIEDPNVVLVSTQSGMPQTGGIRTFVLPLAVVLAILCTLFFGVTFYNQRRSKKERNVAE